MRDRHSSKKNVKFYYFDLFKTPIKESPQVLFFENDKPVVVNHQKNSMVALINSCWISIENSKSFTNDQQILMDLFAKGLYYKNITNYSNFYNYFRALRSARKNSKEKAREFGEILKNAIDGRIGRIEILSDGRIISSPPEALTKNEIDNI